MAWSCPKTLSQTSWSWDSGYRCNTQNQDFYMLETRAGLILGLCQILGIQNSHKWNQQGRHWFLDDRGPFLARVAWWMDHNVLSGPALVLGSNGYGFWNLSRYGMKIALQRNYAKFWSNGFSPMRWNVDNNKLCTSTKYEHHWSWGRQLAHLWIEIAIIANME